MQLETIGNIITANKDRFCLHGRRAKAEACLFSLRCRLAILLEHFRRDKLAFGTQVLCHVGELVNTRLVARIFNMD